VRFYWTIMLCMCIVFVPVFATGNGEEAGKANTATNPSTHIPPHSLKHQTPKPDIPREYEDLVKAYDRYWELFIKKDFNEAYKMESADYRKATPFKAEHYVNALVKNFTLKSVRSLEAKKISEKEVMVQGNYYYGIEGMKGVKPFTDKWVKEDGAWMHMPSEGQFKK